MFGKLTLDSIPIHEPIVFSTIIFIILISVVILGIVSYFGKWRWIWNEWFTTVDHKKIGIMYIIVAIIMLFRGFADAIMMRLQQSLVSSGGLGFLSPHHYDQIFTAHGVIMIFFMATPFVIGFMNLIIPLQIGARDVAFPILNSLSFWLFIVGVILINLSLGFGEFAQTGWLAYPPLSEKEFSPGVGVDYWIWSLQISGIGTTLSGINFFSTILKMRTKGMSMMKVPVFIWTSFCSSILIILSFPILTTVIGMLTLDRYLGMHFFTNSMGGNAMMYVNLIWAWGHPEVYILVLPVFGIFSEITATFSKKSLFGYTSLVWATVSITILSFIVWLHHFFTMGSGANVNSFFGIATMVIAIPTGVKVFNWLFTMYRGKILFKTPMLWTVGFIITFSIGGMTGVLLAVPGANFVLHNSLFLIGHFHNVIIGGVVFGCFAGLTYWFPKAFGFLLNEKWGIRAFWFWISGFFIAFIPLYILGLSGMTRRLSYDIDSKYHFLLTIALFGVFLIFLGVICQIIQIIVSIRERHNNIDYTGDPWDGRTLEWSISSPAPIYNFAIKPKVDSRDEWWKIKKKFLLQTEKINKYKSIHIPKNTSFGFFVGLFSLIFGFSMIWNIWWLAITGFIFVILIWILKSFDEDINQHISIQEIQNFEKKRFYKFKKK